MDTDHLAEKGLLPVLSILLSITVPFFTEKGLLPALSILLSTTEQLSFLKRRFSLSLDIAIEFVVFFIARSHSLRLFSICKFVCLNVYA